MIAAVVVVVAVVVAVVVQRRRPVAERAPSFQVPPRLDRGDFDRPDTPWLVAVFTAATCDTCAGVLARARPLASDELVVQEVEVAASRALHQRYGIDAVPLVVVADAAGAVRAHAFGPQATSDLWGLVAQARAEPPAR